MPTKSAIVEQKTPQERLDDLLGEMLALNEEHKDCPPQIVHSPIYSPVILPAHRPHILNLADFGGNVELLVRGKGFG